MALAPNTLYLEWFCACRRHQAATGRTGDFGTSPIFGQLSDKPLLAQCYYVVCPTWRKARTTTR